MSMITDKELLRLGKGDVAIHVKKGGKVDMYMPMKGEDPSSPMQREHFIAGVLLLFARVCQSSSIEEMQAILDQFGLHPGFADKGFNELPNIWDKNPDAEV